MATPVVAEIISGRPSDWPPPGEMYFRLVDANLGTLDLSCDNGYVIRSYEFAFPQPREVVYPNSLDDGTFDVTRFMGARAVTLDVVFRDAPNVDGTGTPIHSEAELRDQILKFTHALARPNLLFSEHGDSRVRYLTLRGADGPYTIQQPHFNELSVQWVAPGGFIQTLDKLVATVNISQTLDSEYDISINNYGTVPANWQAYIDGEISQPKFTLDGQQSLWLHFDTSLQDSTIINTVDKTVRVGGQPVGYRYLDDQSQWFRIPPGQHTLSVTHQSMPRIGYPFAYWQADSHLTTWAAPSGDPSNNPPPGGAPPWAWSTEIDPDTGQPVQATMTIVINPAWI